VNIVPAPTVRHDAGMPAEPPPVTRVGVIGLGAMGRPMTRHLLARPGTAVGITGRGAERYRDLVDAGATWHDTPRSLAATAQVVVLMLPDLPEVEQVLAGPDGILAATPEDLLLVLCSTSSPAGVRALGERLRDETGDAVRLVDAPVSGGVEGATAATLSIMVGGSDPDAERAADVLRACGRPVQLGPLGAGEVAKACNQLIVAAAVLSIGEALVLAERSGLDLDLLVDVLGGGYADSRILQTRGARMVAEDYEPTAAARYLLKDVEFASAVAADTGTTAALLPAVREAFAELVARGLGDADIGITRRLTAERRPLTVPPGDLGNAGFRTVAAEPIEPL
jgi:2-hydroxy-3-oxopropionate reductase